MTVPYIPEDFTPMSEEKTDKVATEVEGALISMWNSLPEPTDEDKNLKPMFDPSDFDPPSTAPMLTEDLIYSTGDDTKASPSTNEFPWRYNEGKILDEVREYIKATYGEHYATRTNGHQFIDLLMSDDDSIPAFKFTAGRYIHRFGKKSGYNRKDILKAIHYLTFLLEYIRRKNI
jgi:hypothetical protein